MELIMTREQAIGRLKMAIHLLVNEQSTEYTKEELEGALSFLRSELAPALPVERHIVYDVGEHVQYRYHVVDTQNSERVWSSDQYDKAVSRARHLNKVFDESANV